MTPIVLKDLRSRLDCEEVRELVRQLEYPIEIRERKTDEILREYKGRPGQPLMGAEIDGQLVGLVGLVVKASGQGVIRHIVVRRDCRHAARAVAVIFAADEAAKTGNRVSMAELRSGKVS